MTTFSPEKIAFLESITFEQIAYFDFDSDTLVLTDGRHIDLLEADTDGATIRGDEIVSLDYMPAEIQSYYLDNMKV